MNLSINEIEIFKVITFISIYLIKLASVLRGIIIFLTLFFMPHQNMPSQSNFRTEKNCTFR